MTFDSITALLTRMDKKHRFLKGNDPQIRSILKQYRDGDLNILFINARNLGSGLNLENTTDIIMFHKLDTEIEKQVIGRAQRYGRTSALNIWYLLHENEYEQTSDEAGTSADA
jgi:SNF2 family DNA or RNA helicase